MRLPRNIKMLRGPLDASAVAGTLFLFWAATLLHSSLVLPPGLPLSFELPGAPGLWGRVLPGVTVAVDPAERLLFQNQIVRESDLGDRLREHTARQGTNETLLLLADRRVTADTLARLVNLARGAGIRDVVLATSPGAIVPGSREAGARPR